MKDKETDDNWQRQLQLFMKGGVVLLVIVFIGISYTGMRQVKAVMDRGPVLQINTSVIKQFSSDPKIEQQAISALMESYIVSSRYHQAKILTMVNVWTQYLGFLTGMILAFIGSIFILGKIREDVSTIDMQDMVKFTITSSSPGIILAFFGTLLMLLTINVRHKLDIRDDSVYMKPPVNVMYNETETQEKPQEWNTSAQTMSEKEDSIKKKQQAIKDKYKNGKLE